MSMNIMENNPNNVLKPNLKQLLAERQELDAERKSTKRFFERMKISSKIAALDKQIASIDLKTK